MKRPWVAALLVAVLYLIGAGCGSDEGTGGASETPWKDAETTHRASAGGWASQKAINPQQVRMKYGSSGNGSSGNVLPLR